MGWQIRGGESVGSPINENDRGEVEREIGHLKRVLKGVNFNGFFDYSWTQMKQKERLDRLEERLRDLSR